MRAAAYFFLVLTGLGVLQVIELVRNGNPQRPGQELPTEYYVGALLMPLVPLVIAGLAWRAADRQRERFRDVAERFEDDELDDDERSGGW